MNSDGPADEPALRRAHQHMHCYPPSNAADGGTTHADPLAGPPASLDLDQELHAALARVAAVFDWPPGVEARFSLDGRRIATPGFSRRIRRLVRRRVTAGRGRRGTLEVAFRAPRRGAHEPPLCETTLELASAYLGVLVSRHDACSTLTEQHRLLSAIPAVLYVADTEPPYRSRYVSEGVKTLFGYAPEELLRHSDAWLQRIHPDDAATVHARMQALSTCGELRLEYRLRHRDGHYCWVHDQLTVARDVQGRPSELIGYLGDIGELKEAESGLLRRDAVLEAVAFAASELMRVDDWNEIIPSVLARLGEAAAVSRVYLFENHRERGELCASQRYEWAAPGAEPQIDNPELQGLSYRRSGLGRWPQVLSHGDIICGPVRELPAGERPILEAEAIRSILIVPIFVDDQWWGNIGFDDCTEERRWSQAAVDALKAAAGVVGAIIQRARAEAALRRSEAEYRQLFDSSNDGFAVLDARGRAVAVNAASARLSGYTPEEQIGRSASDFVHPDSMHHFHDLVAGRGLGAGRLVEGKLLHKDGHAVWVEARGASITYQGAPHRLVVLRDITERKQREAAIAKAQRALRALSHCNESLVRADTEQALLRSICRIIVDAGYRFCWVGCALDDEQKTVQPIAKAGYEQGYLEGLRVTWGESAHGQGPAGAAIRTRQSVLSRDIANDPKLAPWRREALARGYASCIALPLHHPGLRALGVLVIYAAEANAFDPEEVRLLCQLADNLAYGISAQRESAERRETEQALVASKRQLENIFNGVEVFLWDEDLSAVWHELEQLRAQGVHGLRDHLRRHWSVLKRLAGLVHVNNVNDTALRLLYTTGRSSARDQIDRFYPPETLDIFLDALCAMWQGDEHVRGETTLTRPDGETLVGLLSMRVPRSEEEARHVPVSVVDITERKRAEAEIEYLAAFDPLTGLPNRRSFTETLRMELERSRRQGTSLAVLLLDVDHFKDVNDTLGHSTGDELLKLVGARLRAILRRVDTVARFGGDEFAVLLTDPQDPTHAGTVAEKLLAQIDCRHTLEGNHVYTSASIGVALAESDTTAERLLTQADMALYRAKEEGRNTYRFHTDDMDSAVRSRVTLAKELREALKRDDQLHLHYQPQVDLRDGSVIGVEALVRWRHPERGALSPGVFIPVAEVTGLIVPLGRWVLGEACHQARAWLDAGMNPGVMAVNVSGIQLRAADLERDVMDALHATGLPPERLELELTESILMESARGQGTALERLHRLGVGFAIDDFGTGYSSLEYLRAFPVSRIKIAQVFVRDLTTDPNDAAIVKATLGLAQELGIPVIAEGVETEEQMRLLWERGCEQAQGYYFSRPLPPAVLWERLPRRLRLATAAGERVQS